MNYELEMYEQIEALNNEYTRDIIKRKNELQDTKYSINSKSIIKANEDVTSLKNNMNEFFLEKFPDLNTDVYHIDYTKHSHDDKYYINLKNMFDINIFFSEIAFHSSIEFDTLNGQNYFIDDIILPKLSCTNTFAIYAHELVHLLTLRNQYAFPNELDKEMLSIFIEKINIKEDSFEYHLNEFIRWSSLNLGKDNVNFDESTLIKAYMYYNSFIKANYLYHLYRNMNYCQRTILFEAINFVFQGILNMDQFCFMYDIDLNNKNIYDISIDSINNAKKNIVRKKTKM